MKLSLAIAKEYAHRACNIGNHRKVEPVLRTGEVSCGNRSGSVADWVVSVGVERAITVPQQNGVLKTREGLPRRSHVKFAIVIKVADGNRVCGQAVGQRGGYRSFEGPIAVAEQHLDAVAVEGARLVVALGRDYVQSSVAGKVPKGYHVRLGRGVIGNRRLERPVAVAQHHPNIVAGLVVEHQVEYAVIP